LHLFDFQHNFQLPFYLNLMSVSWYLFDTNCLIVWIGSSIFHNHEGMVFVNIIYSIPNNKNLKIIKSHLLEFAL
jgi:hypothetical protein